MVVNRDLSAMTLARWPRHLREVLDGLAATGAWGVRMLLEADVRDAVFSDVLPTACDLVRANLRHNGVSGMVLQGPFAYAVKSRPFDFIDIDPFGSPGRFVDDAIRHARTPVGLGITATDAAALSGTYPEACLRRYGARSLRCPQGHELGLRILLGYVARLAAAQGRAVQPLLAFSAEHFLRLFILLTDGRNARVEAPVRYVLRQADGSFVLSDARAKGAVGPCWTGAVSDPSLLSRLRPSEWTRPGSARLLHRLQEEAAMPPFFVTTDELAKHGRVSPPKLDRFVEALRDEGFRATRTHFDPRGVKTNAAYGDVLRVFRTLAAIGPRDG